MTRVFHIITHFDVGGAERVAANIAHSRTSGMEYHLVEVLHGRSQFTPTFIAELRAAGIKLHRSPMPEFHFHYVAERVAAWLFPLWFVWVARKWRPNVIHCHTEVPELATWCLFHLVPWAVRSVKVVRTVHNTRLWSGIELTGKCVEAWLKKRKASVAISESVRENYEKVYGVRLPIIYNGVDAHPGRKRYERLRAGRMNILFAGRLEKQKGISHLVDIVRQRKGDDRYFFHILGDGRLRPQLVEALADCDNAELQPPLYGLSDYLASFDYLLMPSEHEGLSMLSVEASFAGLPVIANACPGLKDTLPDDWPLLVTDNEQAQYAQLFGSILPTAPRADLARKARLFVEEHFTLQRMQQQYEARYGC